MLRLILVLFIFLFPLTSNSQESLDSIVNLLSVETEDSINLRHYKTLADGYRNSNLDNYYRYSLGGLILAQNINDQFYEAQFTQELGYYYRKSNKIDSAYLFYEKSKEIFIAIPDSAAYYYVDYDLGNLNRAEGKYVEAQQAFVDGLGYYQGQHDSLSANRVLIGRFNLGTVYSFMHDFEESIKNYKQVLQDPSSRKDKRLLHVVYLNLSNSFLELDQLDSAIYYSQKGELLSTSKQSSAHINNSLGVLHKKQDKYFDALNYFERSKQLFLEIGDTMNTFVAMNNIGGVMTKLGNYKLAEELLLDVEKQLESSKNRNTKQMNFSKLRELYFQKKNFKAAYEYLLATVSVKDSLVNIENRNAIADLEIKYDTEKLKSEKSESETKVILAEGKSKRNRLFFIATSIIGGLILLSSIFFFSRLKEKKKAEIILLELRETQKRLALEKQYRSSELKALKSQMNPHFIFNALNSIQEYIITNEKDLAAEYLGRFADLIRAYLNYSNEGTVTLDEEIKTLEMYLQLEELRFEEKLNYEISVDDKLVLEEIEIPTMLIQPYVENAFKHGLLHKKDNRNLLVKFDLSSDKKKLLCIVQDDGIGRENAGKINAKRNQNHKSFSSKATEDRLALLNYGKENKIVVEIHDLKTEDDISNGTKVMISIPLS